jgi:hypothetical protein
LRQRGNVQSITRHRFHFGIGLGNFLFAQLQKVAMMRLRTCSTVALGVINTNLITGQRILTNLRSGIPAASQSRNISSNWTMEHCTL